ncbi:MAG TPA: LysM peptidoglycan-binding domain-containing protein, partial [Thermomicrobiales bacterium]|nr:LysM peptidoglycan-binding domain-containing protein [Thermomicrobiales bacterium]
ARHLLRGLGTSLLMSVVLAAAALLIHAATLTLNNANSAPSEPAGGTNITARPSASAQAPRLYVIRPGDTLRTLAQRFYGDQALWPVLFEANRRRLQQAEDIQVGTQIIVPDR